MRYILPSIFIGILILSTSCTMDAIFEKKENVVVVNDDDFYDFDVLSEQQSVTNTFEPEKEPSSLEVAIRQIGMPIFIFCLKLFGGLQRFIQFLYSLLPLAPRRSIE